MGQSKVEGLTICGDLNQDSVDTVLFTVEHWICPVEDAYTGFMYVTLRGITSVIRNQWECRIQNFKFFWPITRLLSVELTDETS